ncbi:MAG TPA: hypothetical protein VKN76_11925 [Kiloniellaceae bacterium]|nr:hypothetical protein [Kiloniellaceae bacterium]
MKRSILSLAVLAALVAAGSPAVARDAQIVELTQTGCQFLEPENGVDRHFETRKKADCEAVNEASGAARLAEAKVLALKPGKYIFRVTNRDVPYNLGFWLRGDGVVGRIALPSVSGGGLATGVTKDYEIELSEGEYLYSCPLNPTPDYRIVVGG